MNTNRTTVLAIDPTDEHIEAVIEVETDGKLTIMSSDIKGYLKAHSGYAIKHYGRAVKRLLQRRYVTSNGAARVLTVWA